MVDSVALASLSETQGVLIPQNQGSEMLILKYIRFKLDMISQRVKWSQTATCRMHWVKLARRAAPMPDSAQTK